MNYVSAELYVPYAKFSILPAERTLIIYTNRTQICAANHALL